MASSTSRETYCLQSSIPLTKTLQRIDGRNRDGESKKAAQGEQGLIEIDRNLNGLLQQVKSRMSSRKLTSIKRTMHSLTGLIKPRKSKSESEVMPLGVQMKPN